VTRRDARLFVDDMLQAVEDILEVTAGLDRQQFMATPVLQKAIIHDLLVLGEAAAQMPDDVRPISPDIPWRRIVGMRNKLIHGYFGVDLDLVYVVAKKTVPALLDPLERLRAALDAG
jgi:uncharacterized protein with HEPN domain